MADFVQVTNPRSLVIDGRNKLQVALVGAVHENAKHDGLGDSVRNFRELKVWEKAHQLTLSVYRATVDFPAEEKFGLTSQLRRAAAAIPANIAEGCGRAGERELARFLQIAMGSASELEYHLLLAHDLDLVDAASYQQLHDSTTEVKGMLTSFIRKLTADR